MDIVLVRHGRTDINLKGLYAGALDTDLSAKGIDDINNIKNIIRQDNYDKVFTSPLKRCTQSTEIIFKSYIKDSRLVESNFGIFEGLSYDEIVKQYPNESKNWQKDYFNYAPPHGESLKQVFSRTKDFIEEVKNKYNKIIVFTHGGVIRSALSLVFNNNDYFYKFRVDHGSINVISIENDYYYVKMVNGFSSFITQ